jgi:hypothetical protein
MPMYTVIQEMPTFVSALNGLERIDRFLRKQTNKPQTPQNSTDINDDKVLFSLEQVSLGWNIEDCNEVLHDVDMKIMSKGVHMFIGPYVHHVSFINEIC